MIQFRHLINTKQMRHGDYMVLSGILEKYDESTVSDMVTVAEIVNRNSREQEDDAPIVLSIDDELDAIEDRLDELAMKARMLKRDVKSA